MKLTINDLTLALGGRTLLQNAAFTASSGQLTLLLGLNGSGKTTLLKSLCGLIAPKGGEIRLNGRPLAQLSAKERARAIAYLPQQPFNGRQSVFDFALLGATPHLSLLAQAGAQERQATQEALARLSLTPYAQSPLNTLSGGWQRSAQMAQALVQQAEILLLDEPTAYLDFRRQHQFMTTLKNLLAENGQCALVSVHDPNLAVYADQILLLHQQRLRALSAGGPHWPQKLAAELQSIYGEGLTLLEKDDQFCFIYRNEIFEVT